jgi:outer membrane protein assembly factor BamB
MIFSTILLCILVDTADGVPSWPAFLGQGAKVASAEQLPIKWSLTEGVLWSIATPGHGQSSPVAWADKVFLTSTDGPNKEDYHVLCYSAADGTKLWDNTFKNSEPFKNDVYVSRAAPTPVVDQDRVISFFESGDIVAIDHQGMELWKTSIAKKHGKFQNKFGLSGSLVQNDKHFFVLVDDEGPSYIVAMDKATGNEFWKQERTSRSSWSSPAMHTIAGVEQIVVSSGGSVDGYEASTGKLLWSYSDVGGNTACTPVSIGDGKFLIAASAGRDGGNAEMAKKSNALLRVTKNGDAWNASVLWKADEATPSWASPIAHNGCAYWVNRSGLVYCFDVETGKLHYKERTKQSCWATPFGIGDRVYFFGKDGLTTVIAAGNAYRSIAENELWDPNGITPEPGAPAQFAGPTQYGYAILGNKIYMRTGERLFCIGK